MEVMGLSVGLSASSDSAAVRHFHIPEPVRRTCRSGLWSRRRVSRKSEGTESSLLGEEWKYARVPCRGGQHCCVPFVAEGSCLSDSCLPQQGFPKTDSVVSLLGQPKCTLGTQQKLIFAILQLRFDFWFSFIVKLTINIKSKPQAALSSRHCQDMPETRSRLIRGSAGLPVLTAVHPCYSAQRCDGPL